MLKKMERVGRGYGGEVLLRREIICRLCMVRTVMCHNYVGVGDATGAAVDRRDFVTISLQVCSCQRKLALLGWIC